jgi:hypothetical protein
MNPGTRQRWGSGRAGRMVLDSGGDFGVNSISSAKWLGFLSFGEWLAAEAVPAGRTQPSDSVGLAAQNRSWRGKRLLTSIQEFIERDFWGSAVCAVRERLELCTQSFVPAASSTAWLPATR